MKTNNFLLLILFATVLTFGCDRPQENTTNDDMEITSSTADSLAGYGIMVDSLPAPYKTESAEKGNEGKVIGWDSSTPQVAAGFEVSQFAGDLEHPRWIYEAPNGDIFVAESNTKNSANRISIFRDEDGDGTPDMQEVFLEDLNQPFGMLVLNGYFYVANTDGLLRFPYNEGQTKMEGEGEKILELPAGGYNNHWTRNLIANADGTKIYVSVGSASNVAEHGMEEEERRADILEINPDGSGERIYASGLRNPVGMDWAPGTNTLWTAVNERDGLGDNLVPDYITSVQEGGFYGWPYSYYGQHEDPRLEGEAPDMVAKAIVPDVAVGPHTASLGLAFYDKEAFPEKYHGGAFVAQHGSWNRSVLNGYAVLFVPFENGQPTGKPENFLTGFIADMGEKEVYGRPVCVRIMSDGSMLLSDDDAGVIWRISASQVSS